MVCFSNLGLLHNLKYYTVDMNKVQYWITITVQNIKSKMFWGFNILHDGLLFKFRVATQFKILYCRYEQSSILNNYYCSKY